MILQDITWPTHLENSFYLFEGKLLFENTDTAEVAFAYLTNKYPQHSVSISDCRDWDHWQKCFQKEIVIKDEKI